MLLLTSPQVSAVEPPGPRTSTADRGDNFDWDTARDATPPAARVLCSGYAERRPGYADPTLILTPTLTLTLTLTLTPNPTRTPTPGQVALWQLHAAAQRVELLHVLRLHALLLLTQHVARAP